MKVWHETAHHTLELRDELPNLTAYVEKKLLALDGRYLFTQTPVRLHTLYVLERYDPSATGRTDVTIHTLSRREALMALRTYVAFDLASRAAQPELEARLAEIDACIDRVDGLWIERPPAELRGGIAGTLTGGLEQVYELGRILALGP